uniref:Putative secreted protein n=1 Tax=Anopheles darlingi TaxID=43151 RepID=A0A2M4D4M2_ANODA
MYPAPPVTRTVPFCSPVMLLLLIVVLGNAYTTVEGAGNSVSTLSLSSYTAASSESLSRTAAAASLKLYDRVIERDSKILVRCWTFCLLVAGDVRDEVSMIAVSISMGVSSEEELPLAPAGSDNRPAAVVALAATGWLC